MGESVRRSFWQPGSQAVNQRAGGRLGRQEIRQAGGDLVEASQRRENQATAGGGV